MSPTTTSHSNHYDPRIFSHYFHLRSFPWLTLTLLSAITLLYYLLPLTPYRWDALLAWGAGNRTLSLEHGQWWRLISGALLHLSFWHLAVNLFFLLHLGGIAEAIFRRLDYAILLFMSAVGASLASIGWSHTSTCGASGIVFGIWGALITFAWRYKNSLPKKYQLFFFGCLLPYGIVALVGAQWLGTTAINHAGHLGGLCSGIIAGILMPPQLLTKNQPHAKIKWISIPLMTFLFFISPKFATHGGPLYVPRTSKKMPLAVPIPTAWTATASQLTSYSYANNAGAAIGVETQRHIQPINPSHVAETFIRGQLAQDWELAQLHGARIDPPHPMQLAGQNATHIKTQIVTLTGLKAVDYYILQHGSARHIINFSRPHWMQHLLQPTWDNIIKGIAFKPNLLRQETSLHPPDSDPSP